MTVRLGHATTLYLADLRYCENAKREGANADNQTDNNAGPTHQEQAQKRRTWSDRNDENERQWMPCIVLVDAAPLEREVVPAKNRDCREASCCSKRAP